MIGQHNKHLNSTMYLPIILSAPDIFNIQSFKKTIWKLNTYYKVYNTKATTRVDALAQYTLLGYYRI